MENKHEDINTLTEEQIKEKEEFLNKQEEVKNYLKELLHLEKIETFIIIADGYDKKDRYVWNFRLNGDGRFIIALLEQFKVGMLTNNLNHSKLVSVSKQTLKDTQ